MIIETIQYSDEEEEVDISMIQDILRRKKLRLEKNMEKN